jgi:ParB-like chromosome segregation protein Spo0J
VQAAGDSVGGVFDAGQLDEVVSPGWLEAQPVSLVRLDELAVLGTPRRGGPDPAHVRLLAGSAEALPPIVVHRPTMRVIDGVHRVRAAALNGRDRISARLLDCDDSVALVLAVRANVTHGLPLSRDDRAAAAARLVARHPDWSDRALAAVTGLSHKAVARVRDTPGAPAAPAVRVGRDGRRRPVRSGRERERAAALLAEHPELGLRAVARASGLSVATVRDVRDRLRRGGDPVPDRCRAGSTPAAAHSPAPDPPTPDPPTPGTSGISGISGIPGTDPAGGGDGRVVLAGLCADPSVRFSAAGREAVRWLLRHAGEPASAAGLGGALPEHWAPAVAELARGWAEVWTGLAEQLDRRAD